MELFVHAIVMLAVVSAVFAVGLHAARRSACRLAEGCSAVPSVDAADAEQVPLRRATASVTTAARVAVPVPAPDLGPLGGYHLPPTIRSAYRVDTAQELADRLGVARRPGPGFVGLAGAAYRSLKAGDAAPARTLLIDTLGVSEASAEEALAELPAVR